MAEVVDSIIADLQVRYQQYVKGFDAATAAHARFTKSVPKVGEMAGISASDAQGYADRHKKAANDVADAAEKSTARVKRTVKDRVDTETAADRKRTADAKAAADEQIRIAQEREARLSAIAERAASRGGVRPGSGRNLGATVPREGGSHPTFVDAGAVEEVAIEKEINHAMVDRVDLQAKLLAAEGAEKAILKDKIVYLDLIDKYQRQGVSEVDAAFRAEERVLAIQKFRAEHSAKQAATSRTGQSGLRQAGSAAIFGYSPGGGALAGLAIAGTAAAGIEAIKFATDYGKELNNVSSQLGITTRDLQVYQAAALQSGVSNEQFRTSLGQLATSLGKAQEGDKQSAKAFAALGVNIKGVASAGDLLPTLIDRISSIKDPAQRAAIETRLFGEEGRKLDGLLSGGNQKVNDLAKALEDTGAILSSRQIKDLDQTSKKLAEVKAQLAVDIAGVVGNNASAIERLATSFGHLADAALRAIDPLSNKAALDKVSQTRQRGIFENDHDIGFGRAIPGFDRVTGAPTESDALKALLQTQQGRAGLRQQIADQRKSIASVSSNSLIGNLSSNGLFSPAARDPRAALAALAAQEKALDAAEAAAAKAAKTAEPAVQSGSVNSKLLKTLNAPSGKSAETLAKEAAARQKAFNDQLAQSDAEYLKARKELTVGADEQYHIQIDELKVARDKRNADIASEVKTKQIDAANGPLLVAANEKAYQEKLAVAALERQVAAYNAITDATLSALSTQDEILRVQASLADTAAQRRTIELKLLDNAQRAEQIAAVSTIFSDDPKVTDKQRSDAARTLATSGARHDAAVDAAKDKTRGPLETYTDSLPTTAAKVDEAFQSAAVHGLESFNTGLSTSIDKMLHLHGLAGQLLSDIIKIGLEKAVVAPIAAALFGGGSGGGGGNGLLGTIGGILGSALGGGSFSAGAVNTAGLAASSSTGLASFTNLVGTGFASGGVLDIAGNGGIDQNQLSINGSPVARVSQGEKLAIVPGNFGAPGPNVSAPGAGASPVVNRFNLDLRGTLMTEDVLRSLQAEIQRSEARAVNTAVTTTRRGAPSASARYGALGTTG